MWTAAGLRAHQDDKQGRLSADRNLDLPMVLLAVALVALFLVPTRLIVGPLRSFGSPAFLLLLCFVFVALVGATGRRQRTQPLLVAALALFVLTLVLTAVHSLGRGLDEIELAGARRTVVRLSVLAAVCLSVGAVMSTRRRASALLGWLTTLGAATAAVGVMQYFGLPYVEALSRIPGLTLNVEVGQSSRGALTRVSGAATHPIEFSVVVAALLPLAVQQFRLARHQGARITLPLIRVILIGVAVPLAVSRSGLLGIVAGIGYTALFWPWRTRYIFAVVAAGAAALLTLAVPGLYGAFRFLFVGAASDSSVQARTADYPLVAEYFSQSPWLGRGPGTFLPDLYFIVDNQVLITAMEQGWLGLAALAVLIGSALRLGWRAGKARDLETAWLAQGATGGLLALAVALVTFDLLSFFVASTLLMLLIGVLAGLAGLAAAPETGVRSAEEPFHSSVGASDGPNGSGRVTTQPAVLRSHEELAHVVRAVRRRWRVLAGCMAGAALLAWAPAGLTPARYEASATIYAYPVLEAEARNVRLQRTAYLVISRRMSTYAQLATVPTVIEPAMDELGLDGDPADVAAVVRARLIGNRDLLELTAHASSPDEASALANAVADSVVRNLPGLTGPTGSDSLAFRVVESSTPAQSPRVSKTARNLVLALSAALLLGVGLAVWRDERTPLVRRPQDLAALGPPVLADFPLPARRGRGLTTDREASRVLRTNVEFASYGRPCIAVVSPRTGDERTTVARGLATALAAAGRSVVVVAADLRDAAPGGRPGLSDILAGNADIAACSEPAAGGYCTISAGTYCADPSVATSGERLTQVLRMLAQDADYVVLDVPPLLEAVEAVNVAAAADSVILVLGRNRTTTRDARRVLDLLGSVDRTPIGLVVTAEQGRGRLNQAYMRNEPDAGAAQARRR